MSNNGNVQMAKAIELFFIESREMLAGMETNLLILEKNPDDIESINSIFRAVHTIKGSSGMFNLNAIEDFTHVVENVMELFRKGKLIFNEELAEILLQSHDYIGMLLDIFENDNSEELDSETIQKGTEIISNLGQIKNTYAFNDDSSIEFGMYNADLRVENNYWHISLRFGKDVFRHGLDPKSFISYLNEVGEIVNIVTIDYNIPSLAELDPESCCLGFEIVFKGEVSRKELLDVFAFVQDDCEIRLIPPKSNIKDYISIINEIPDSPMKIGDILVQVGSLTEDQLRRAISIHEKEISKSQKMGNNPLNRKIMVNKDKIHGPIIDNVLEKQKDANAKEKKKNKYLKIDAEKLDELINIIGELVITGSNVRQLVVKYGDTTINQSMDTMSRLIENIRDRIMNVRTVEIGDALQRFERVVRDLGREKGKDIKLTINGGETELDKTLVEKIMDPLMHIVRNSIDHGIDTPEERLKKGKESQGNITINSYYETGSVVIEIRDDGNGLNYKKIRKNAVERGIISSDQEITEQDLLQLVFEPGFSTADEVTNISGRGVGMDVVKRNIEAMRGNVVLESIENVGTMARIHLPLTLAIIDGFLVMIAGSYYIIPLDLMCEVFDINHDELNTKEGANVINLRGEVLPFMRLRDFFNENQEDIKTECVVVVEYARSKAGLVVDYPIGEFQTVIKSMGPIFKDTTWASGATILGSGEVALILDIPRLVEGEGFDYNVIH